MISEESYLRYCSRVDLLTWLRYVCMADNVFIDESEGDSGGENVEILEEQQYLPLEKAKSPV